MKKKKCIKCCSSLYDVVYRVNVSSSIFMEYFFLLMNVDYLYKVQKRKKKKLVPIIKHIQHNRFSFMFSFPYDFLD